CRGVLRGHRLVVGFRDRGLGNLCRRRSRGRAAALGVVALGIDDARTRELVSALLGHDDIALALVEQLLGLAQGLCPALVLGLAAAGRIVGAGVLARIGQR